MRARRAASIEAAVPDEGQTLRDAAELLAPAVAETLRALDLGPEHAGAVQLARRYAAALDQARDPAWAMRWIGPLLLQSLEALGATPAARAALDKGKTAPPAGPSRLDQLRSARSVSDRGRGRL